MLDGKLIVGFEVTAPSAPSALGVAEGVPGARRTACAKRYPQGHVHRGEQHRQLVRESYWVSILMCSRAPLLAIIVVWFFLQGWRATLRFFDRPCRSRFCLLSGCSLRLQLPAEHDDDAGAVAGGRHPRRRRDRRSREHRRHLRNGKPPKEAAEEAVDGVGLAVVATSMTLCAVFLPVAFMPGIPGKFFKQFAVTTVRRAVLAAGRARPSRR